MVRTSLETATGQLVVTAPGSVLEEVAAAIVDAAQTVRIVVPAAALESARWVPRGRLADALAAGSALRTNGVDSLAVVGEGVAATVDGTVTPPTAWILDDPDETVVRTYTDVWESATETEFDASRASAVRAAAEAIGGQAAVDDLATMTQPVRDDAPDAIATAVWAAAGASPRLQRLTGTVADHLDCTERTVENRIQRLCDGGVLARMNAPTDSPSRPETILVRRVDPPLGHPVRSLFARE
jgi:hypothetical protein